MALLHQSSEDKKFDSRVVEKNINRGMITAKDLQAHLQTLPDDADNADYISIESLESDDSEN